VLILQAFIAVGLLAENLLGEGLGDSMVLYLLCLNVMLPYSSLLICCVVHYLFFVFFHIQRYNLRAP
jgi:hypothetical protein